MSEQPGVGAGASQADEAGFSEAWEELAREEAGPAAQDAAPRAEPRLEPPAGEERQEFSQPGDPGRHDPDAAERPAGHETTDDIWANASEAQRAALRELEARARRAENVARSHGGRLSAATRELNDLRASLAAPPAPPGDAGDGAARSGRGASDEELERIAAEYDDFAPAFVQEIRSLRSTVQRLEQDATRRAELDQALAVLDRTERMAREEQALARDHADWGEVVRSEDFAEWALAQPRMVHDALIRNAEGIVDGAEAAKILSDFKRDRGGGGAEPLAARRGRQLEGSRHIQSRAPALEARGRGSGSFDDEWDRAADEERRRRAPL